MTEDESMARHTSTPCKIDAFSCGAHGISNLGAKAETWITAVPAGVRDSPPICGEKFELLCAGDQV